MPKSRTVDLVKPKIPDSYIERSGNRLLLSSNSVITGMRPTLKKTTKPFLKETVEMLLPADTVTKAVSSDDENLADAAEESSDEPWMSSPDE
ncbi:hypothetical protein ILUMI_00054 [Ignelater luminosus]|uniref:Uncharacterized protein n=1 Tax=Ignelater luminosus TaxID=2038154 RepID=A0A8K0DGZ8_IGNLU|nr:hypothetical protein ILUMI_00054 [Ignelater luminosus]